MAVSTQLGLLLWKNFTYRRRQTVSGAKIVTISTISVVTHFKLFWEKKERKKERTSFFPIKPMYVFVNKILNTWKIKSTCSNNIFNNKIILQCSSYFRNDMADVFSGFETVTAVIR